MIINETGFQGLFIIENIPLQDERGLFSRVFCKKELFQICKKEIVQINHSVNNKKGTIRGMHYQVSPYAESKLIRCIQGSVFDVAIDLRKNSKTFLKWFGIVLSKDNWKMIFIPEGFAHGFQTLEANTELLYHHTGYYSPEYERGLNFNDPVININWEIEQFTCSEKDLHLPLITNNFIGL